MIMKNALMIAVASLVFATPAYAVKCNDPEVIASFKNWYICTNLINCKAYGAKDLATLQALDDDTLKQRFEAQPQEAAARGVAARGEAAAKVIQDSTSITEGGILAGKTLIASVQAVPSDYNEKIGKYTCDADVALDDNSLTSMVTFALYHGFINSVVGKTLVDAAVKTNNTQSYDLYFAMEVTGKVALLKTHVNSTMTYSVQPVDMDKPDGEFILKVTSPWVQ
jgi:hypothetical protein